MQTNMAENMGNKYIYIRAFWPREISQSTSHRSIQSNIATPGYVTIPWASMDFRGAIGSLVYKGIDSPVDS